MEKLDPVEATLRPWAWSGWYIEGPCLIRREGNGASMCVSYIPARAPFQDSVPLSLVLRYLPSKLPLLSNVSALLFY